MSDNESIYYVSDQDYSEPDQDYEEYYDENDFKYEGPTDNFIDDVLENKGYSTLEIHYYKEYGRYGKDLIKLKQEYEHIEEYDYRGAYGWDVDYSKEIDKKAEEAYNKWMKLKSDTKKIQAIKSIDEVTEVLDFKLDKFILLDILKMADL